jgi:molybdopterin-synthase adenylyltransferase
MSERTDRNERLFGAEGQRAIARKRVAIAGLGGLGSHVAQQLAYLGIQDLRLIDDDVVSESSLNRLIGAFPADTVAGRLKVEVIARHITSIEPAMKATVFPFPLEDPRSWLAFETADAVIGCVDNDGARLQLTEIAMRAGVAYLDLASDIDPSLPSYGGRVFLSLPGVRCLSCVGVLDQNEITLMSMNEDERAVHARLYGVDVGALGSAGPAVVSINGTVASLAVTEFMLWATGIREPFTYLVYLGHQALIRRNTDPPAPSCFYCRPIRDPDDG